MAVGYLCNEAKNAAEIMSIILMFLVNREITQIGIHCPSTVSTSGAKMTLNQSRSLLLRSSKSRNCKRKSTAGLSGGMSDPMSESIEIVMKPKINDRTNPTNAISNIKRKALYDSVFLRYSSNL